MAKTILGGIASGLTIAALFRTSFEAFDIFQTSWNQDLEYRKLRLRLNIEKCRLYNWGESMGLIDIMEVDQEATDDAVRFPQAARNILEDLFRLFHDAEEIKNKYGCRLVNASDGLLQNGCYKGPDISNNLPLDSATFQSELSQVTKIKQNITWVVYDRKKFTLLINEIKELIDRLKEITSPLVVMSGFDQSSRPDIKNIQETEALALIAGICSTDHPDVIRLRQRTPYASAQVRPEKQNQPCDDTAQLSVSSWSRYQGARL